MILQPTGKWCSLFRIPCAFCLLRVPWTPMSHYVTAADSPNSTLLSLPTQETSALQSHSALELGRGARGRREWNTFLHFRIVSSCKVPADGFKQRAFQTLMEQGKEFSSFRVQFISSHPATLPDNKATFFLKQV